VLTGKTCVGKGIFVIDGSDITVRNITFMRAAVPDRNGAGIRAEGRNLTVEKSRFIDNENGILANGNSANTIHSFEQIVW
jgi:pectate lyase